MTATGRIVLLGGTGFVGQAVCERLAGSGLRITVPTRRVAHAKSVQFLPHVDPVACDVHDDASLAKLLPGHDAVVNLVAILHGDAAAFEQVHVALPRRLAAACAAAGVRRVVHVSALGVGGDAPSLYLRSKAAGEAALRSAGLDLTILRPSVIFGAGDRSVNLFASLQRWLPVLPLAGASARLQPVWVGDVAEAVARCLRDSGTAGMTFECAGPQVYTLAELVRIAGRLSGHERPVFALPDGLARWQATLMEWLPGTPLLSRDNLLSLRVPNIASGELPGLESLGIRAAALETVASSYLGAGPETVRQNRWRASRRP